jgi:hypothetical protein
MLILVSPIGLLLLILLVAASPGASDDFALRMLAMSGHRLPQAAVARRAAPRAAALPVHVRTTTTSSCERTSARGYVNPLADAFVTPKRIDQGVDYTAGSGVLRAIGPGIVTVVATTDTGWPGAFIEYRLTAGPAAGCSVFYAEGVEPITGLAVGGAVQAGAPVASIVPGWSSGIEIGWGAGSGTATYAAKMGEWSAAADADSIPTAAGESFSLLVASLGGPPGRLENTRR